MFYLSVGSRFRRSWFSRPCCGERAGKKEWVPFGLPCKMHRTFKTAHSGLSAVVFAAASLCGRPFGWRKWVCPLSGIASEIPLRCNILLLYPVRFPPVWFWTVGGRPRGERLFQTACCRCTADVFLFFAVHATVFLCDNRIGYAILLILPDERSIWFTNGMANRRGNDLFMVCIKN